MKRTALLALTLLAACSPSFSARVGDFATPIANSLGQVCWVEVDASGAPPLRTATFRANATYGADLALTGSVRVQVFGRSEAPADACTSRDEVADVPLSEPFEFELGARRPIEIGGDAYGEELADLVARGTLWLGAAAASNVGVGEEILFEDGRITVGF